MKYIYSFLFCLCLFFVSNAQVGAPTYDYIVGCDTLTNEPAVIKIFNDIECGCYEFAGAELEERECDNISLEPCTVSDTTLLCAKWSSVVAFWDNTRTVPSKQYTVEFKMPAPLAPVSITYGPNANFTDQVNQMSALAQAAFPNAIVESRCNTTNGCGGLLPPPSDAPPPSSIVARYVSLVFCPTDDVPLGVCITEIDGVPQRKPINMVYPEPIPTPEKRGWYCKVKGSEGELQDEKCVAVPAADVPACWFTCGETIPEPPEPLCSYQTVGPFCEIQPETFDGDGDVLDAAVIITQDIFVQYTICGTDVEPFVYIIEADGTPTEYTINEENYLGDCDSLEPIEEPLPECPPDAKFDCFEYVRSYGILDNSLWVGAGNHLSNADFNGIDLIHEDGTVTSLPRFTGTYFPQFKTYVEAALPNCKVVYVCANHSSPKGCSPNFVNNLSQYPAYDAPTAPADIQNNLNNPDVNELWATGWLLDCSCASPIVRAEIRESNDAAKVGAYKDIIVYKEDVKVYQYMTCGEPYYQDCDGTPIAFEADPCCLTPCGSGTTADEELAEDDCPQVGVITPIGSRPLGREFGDIGQGNTGPYTLNDFNDPIQTESCQTGDFQNNGIVSNAFDLGLTGTAPQTCITVNQTSACAAGVAFVLFQDTPSGGIPLPTVNSGISGWQNLGPYAYDSSTGTDVVTTQVCYNTNGIQLQDLIFVGYGTGGFGSDTECCDSYELVSDIAECEPSSGGGCCPTFPTTLCEDECAKSALRAHCGRPNTQVPYSYGGISGATLEEFSANWNAAGYKTWIAGFEGTGGGECHWYCPVFDTPFLIDGVDQNDSRVNANFEVFSPNPNAAELGCESKEAGFMKICGADLKLLKPNYGHSQVCIDGKPKIMLVEADKTITLIDAPEGICNCCEDSCDGGLPANACEITSSSPRAGGSFEVARGCDIGCDVGDTVTIYNADGSVACTGTVTAATVDQKYAVSGCPVTAGQFLGK